MSVLGCVGSTIRLRSGRYLDLASPQPEDFAFADIAGALSKMCRFGGQIERFYSVAEHCYHCARVADVDGLDDETCRALLLHDAAEAFIGDVVKPLKILLGPNYGTIEWNIESAIERKFGLSFIKHREAIKEIDFAMLIAERKAMFSRDGVEWAGEKQARPIRVDFKRWLPSEAEEMFVFRARELGVSVCE